MTTPCGTNAASYDVLIGYNASEIEATGGFFDEAAESRHYGVT